MTKISLIVAVADNQVIGLDNEMPWYLPEDFKHFKETTLGKPCIMGRKTFESIIERNGKPLPKRTSIVISRSGYSHEGAICVSSLEEAIEAAKKQNEQAQTQNEDEIIIMGGAQIYALSLPIANRIYYTQVHQSPKGDAFFPKLGDEWYEINRDDRDGFSIVIYELKNLQNRIE